jgi:uncharacterized protein
VPVGKSVTEESKPGSGFQSEVTVAWERSLALLYPFANKHYTTRFGIVLSNEGGAYPQMVLPARLGVSALGSGRQMLSWIHVEDVCNAIINLMLQKPASGIYNVVGDEPVDNKTFMNNLSLELGTGIRLPAAPAFAMKLMLGEMAQLVLGGATVSCEKLKNSHFVFQYPTLRSALQELVSSK